MNEFEAKLYEALLSANEYIQWHQQGLEPGMFPVDAASLVSNAIRKLENKAREGV